MVEASVIAFKELEFGHLFFCKPTTDEWAVSFGLTHEYTSENGHRRFLKLLKTVAYVAVDEDAMGCPVLDKWAIRQIPTIH